MNRDAFMAALAGALACGAAAVAQSGPLPIDQGIDDVDPLRTSLRVPLERDLRIPTGWDAVYPVRYRDPSGQIRQGFARAHGAMIAVFPWSVYTPSRGGMIADVPPGTVFHLGTLPPADDPELRPPSAEHADSSARPPRPPRPEPLRLSLKVDPTLPPTPQPAAAESVGVRGIWTDETYRRRRISSLLQRAAAEGP